MLLAMKNFNKDIYVHLSSKTGSQTLNRSDHLKHQILK